MTMRSERQIRATTRDTEPSTRARPMVAVSVSRLNQATRWPDSMALAASASHQWVLPVPDGPASTRFSARPSHSSVARACWVGSGMADSVSRQDSRVLPEGKPAALRRVAFVAASRPVASSTSSTRSVSAGSQRWARAVARTSGAARRM